MADEQQHEHKRQLFSAAGKKVVIRSPEEYASEAAGADGWECPQCGCRELRTINNYMTMNGRRRRRVCRHCGPDGGVIYTTELPVPRGFRVIVVPVDRK